ncbi:HpcH/HpaI aldolase [Gemmatirosa kalamazoonensis]|uniref:HpcH/HpaI aldolase n=1 Tax=Gemmatirosa kalamazoonensis TaxID=861299 RepID=W0RFY6_9BACT|nr:aldolase/citrate lyase family protein [Gemmatirosa kalamazoonensis]AHG89686.1 HpcH/HpaI aldolase [Gemmatirosa kalamazoonensis]
MSAFFDPDGLDDAEAALREANLAFARRYPGERAARQPVHTLIEGAQHFTADVAARRGAEALAALGAHAPDAASLGRALGIDGHPALEAIVARVRDKLAREPVEDYRIDFEDGFGVRDDDDEDQAALDVAAELARGVREARLPSSIGVRVKPLTEELRARSVRTLGLLVGALVESGALPERWVVTLPKVTVAEQVAYFVAALRAMERATGLADGALRFEIQLEVPQAIVDATGRSLLPAIVDASDGRLDGVNLGVYDYTAALGITAAHQRLRHPACDHARHVIQTSLAGTGVWLADGSTALLPVPRHDGDSAGVHAGWHLHFDDVRHSLAAGWYQGWDLHAAQLVSRHAAVTSFFLEGVDAAGARLRNFVERAHRTALVGGVLDEPATGQALLAFFHRAMSAGAIADEDAERLTGVTGAELREPSFARVLARRGIR